MAFLTTYFLHRPHTRHELAIALMIWPAFGVLFGLTMWKIFSAALRRKSHEDTVAKLGAMNLRVLEPERKLTRKYPERTTRPGDILQGAEK
jgi:hypothetical protein